MTVRQTLQEASNGTVWSRREGGTTYFLRKVNNRYEVWTSLDSGAKSTVTLDQAVTYYSQRNLVNNNTAAPAPAATPAAPTKPTPQPPTPSPKTTAKPATTADPSKTTANAKATTTVSKPPPIAVVSEPLNDIVINTAPLTIPIIDIKTGKTTGNTTIKLAPIVIPGEKLALPKPETGNTAPAAGPPVVGLSSGIKTAAAGATAQDQANFAAKEDWRVRLSLAPGSNYLYNAQDKGILAPLAKTDGVVFPYTPAVSVNYAASYDQASLTHTNYKVNQYQSSSIDSVNITCDFTAQDVFEANYMLAVIHFFRSMTKMFYGKDNDPKNGTPPPLCYLYGLGGFQFSALPLAITGFNYSLPQDVDYIKTTGASAAGTPQPSVPNAATSTGASLQRLGAALKPGGKGAAPSYGSTPTQNSESTTWVPTKIQLAVTCLPIMSRNQVSNSFSLRDYATGKLLQGTTRAGGGFW